MKVRIIEHTNRLILEKDVNFFIQQVKVINIQYSQTYLADTNDVLRSAMIIYE